MTIRGILIPADDGTHGSKDIPAYFVEAADIFALFKKAGMEYGERVSTAPGLQNNFIAAVDCDGHQKMLKFNRVAQTITRYPGPLAGNVLFLSMVTVEDGYDYGSLSPQGRQFILSHLQRDTLPEFTEEQASVEIDTEGKYEDRPQLKVLGFTSDNPLGNYGRY